MINRLAHQNLQSILDDGCNGKLPDMSKEDWILLEHLVVKYGNTQYNRGRDKGFKDGYLDGKDVQLDLFEDNGLQENK